MVGILQRTYDRRHWMRGPDDLGIPEDRSAVLDVLERAMYLIGRPDSWCGDATAEDAALGVYSMRTAIEHAAADLWAPGNPRFEGWRDVQTLADEARKQCHRALPAHTSDRWARPSSRNDVILVMRAGWYYTFQQVHARAVGRSTRGAKRVRSH